MSRLSTIGVAVGHVEAYRKVARWLSKVAVRFAVGPLVIAPVLGLLGLVLQILPLMLAVRLIGSFETGAGGRPVALPGDLSLTPVLGVVVIIAMLLASAAFRYVSHIIAIGAERRVNTGLSQQILTDFNNLDGPYARWSLEYLVDSDDLRRSVGSGTRFCGMAVRLALVNAVNVFYLVAGVGLLVWLAPLLFLVVVPMFLLAAALAYPLNQRALELGRKFEAVGGARGAALRSRLQYALVDGDDTMDDDALDGDAGQVESSFLDLLESRLKLLELVHFVYAALFALLIGVMLWLLVSGYAAHLLDYSVLLILFFAIRFSFNGLRSIIVFLTSINRNLPAIIRTHRIVGAIDHTKAEKQANAGVGLNDSGWPAVFTFPWTVSAEGEEPRSGSFRKGRAYYFVLQRATTNSLIRHLLTIVRRDHALVAQLAEQALTSDPTIDLASPPAEMVQWIERKLAAGEIIVSQTIIERILATAKLRSAPAERGDSEPLPMTGEPASEAESAAGGDAAKPTPGAVSEPVAAEPLANRKIVERTPASDAEIEALPLQAISAILALAHVFRRTRSRNPMVILNDWRVARLPMATKSAIAAELASRLVIYAMPLPPRRKELSVAEFVFFAGSEESFDQAFPTTEFGGDDVSFAPEATVEFTADEYAVWDTESISEDARWQLSDSGNAFDLLRRNLADEYALEKEDEGPLLLGEAYRWLIPDDSLISRRSRLSSGDIDAWLRNPESWPKIPRFAWHMSGATLLKSGVLAAGTVSIVVAHPLDKSDVIFPLLKIIENDRAPFVGMFKTGAVANWLPPEDTGGVLPIFDDLEDKVLWIASITEEAGFENCSAEQIRRTLSNEPNGADRSSMVFFLAGVHERKKAENSMLVFHTARIFRQTPEFQRALMSRLKDNIVVFVVHWNETIRDAVAADVLFVNSGEELGFAASLQSMTNEQWTVARRAYRRSLFPAGLSPQPS
ncbi:MAG TPA: hypothetical protein VMF90_25765 [Rhizobiaceae bacterium]|nr:hypothetical protein [Rhizobiaceae bacterium]